MSRPSGFKHTEETRQRISIANKGKVRTVAMRKHHKGMLGLHQTPEAKTKQSVGMKEWYKTHTNPQKGKELSPEHKAKLSLAKRGNRNNTWKGGITELIRGIRRSPEYYQWRQAVLKRDDYVCQDCGSMMEPNAHHLRSVFEYPEGIFDVNNGLTLCEDCHKRHTYWQKLGGEDNVGKRKHRVVRPHTEPY